MIRPLIVSMYDYRMTFQQDPNATVRNGFKLHYLQSSAFMAADDIFSGIDQHAMDPEEAIKQWNNKNQELAAESKEARPDYKTRLDEVFRDNNRNYYRNREQERPVSKERSEDYRSPSKADHSSHHSKHPSYSHQQRYHSPPSKESYYSSRFKPERH